MVLFSSFLGFKAFAHGVNTVISSRLDWFRALAVVMASLSTVEAFPVGVVLRACRRALLRRLRVGQTAGLIQVWSWSLTAACVSIAASAALTGCGALSYFLDLFKVAGSMLEVVDEVIQVLGPVGGCVAL